MHIIVISHGEFSKGAIQAAAMIVGECENISAIGLDPQDDLESMGAKIENEIIRNHAEKEEILILSDLYFGSPFNSVVSLMTKYKISHITGMNLAMIIEAVNMMQNGDEMKAIAAACLESGKDGIIDVNEFLEN